MRQHDASQDGQDLLLSSPFLCIASPAMNNCYAKQNIFYSSFFF